MLKVNIEITLDESSEYTAKEAAVIKALGGFDNVSPATPAPVAETKVSQEYVEEPAEEAAPAPVEKKPAPKRATRAKAAPSTRAAVLEDQADDFQEEVPGDPEADQKALVEDPAEDLVGEAKPARTLEEAVTAASSLISNGQAQKVRTALAKTSADRVGHLTGDDIEVFLTSLEA